MSTFDDANRSSLRSLAEVLGVPVESFYGEPSPGKLADTAECLRLWERFETDAQRAAALDALREMLGQMDS